MELCWVQMICNETDRWETYNFLCLQMDGELKGIWSFVLEESSKRYLRLDMSLLVLDLERSVIMFLKGTSF